MKGITNHFKYMITSTIWWSPGPARRGRPGRSARGNMA